MPLDRARVNGGNNVDPDEVPIYKGDKGIVEACRDI